MTVEISQLAEDFNVIANLAGIRLSVDQSQC